MIGSFLALVLAGSSAATGAVERRPEVSATPAAVQLFNRDWVLMNWALKLYDSDADIMIEPSEAVIAADAFRKLADANGDGRVTPEEYRAARAFILSRY